MSVENLKPISKKSELFDPLTSEPPDPAMFAQLPASLKEKLLFDPMVFDLPEQTGRANVENIASPTHQCSEHTISESTSSDTTSVEFGIGAMCKVLQALRQVFGPDEQQIGRAELSTQPEPVIQGEILSEKTKRYAPKPMELARKLTKMVRFASCNGQLYIYDKGRGFYTPVMRDEVQTIIIAMLESELEIRGTASQLREVYEFIKHDPHIRVTARPPEHLLCFANGILDTITGEFIRGKNPQHFFTWRLAIDFDPSQQACPVFDSFITQITGGDFLLAERLMQSMAYLLLPSKKMRDIILFQGVGGSGKSVLANLIASFFDQDKVASLAANQLQERFAPFQLVGKRLNLCMDLPKGKLTSESVAFLKLISGDDSVKVEPKGENGWFTHLECRFLFGSNHQFAPAEEDGALTDRVRLIPFRFAVSHEERDYALFEKLKFERSAIFNRLLQAFCRLRANNFIFPGEDIYGIEHACIETDGPIGNFILDCCELVPDAVTPTSEFYLAYCKYCRAHGASFNGKIQPFSRMFNAALPEKGVELIKCRIEGDSRNCYKGIRLIENREER